MVVLGCVSSPDTARDTKKSELNDHSGDPVAEASTVGRDAEMTKILRSRGHQVPESFPEEVAPKEGQRWACRETGKTTT